MKKEDLGNVEFVDIRRKFDSLLLDKQFVVSRIIACEYTGTSELEQELKAINADIDLLFDILTEKNRY